MLKRPYLILPLAILLHACASVEPDTAQFETLPAEELETVKVEPHTVGQEPSQPEAKPSGHSIAQPIKAPINPSLWDQIRPEFTWNTQADRKEVQQFIKQYQSDPDLFQAILNRSQPYLHFLVESLKAANLPIELAFLPFVESGYNPKSNSSSSAAGLWQFIPSTGKHFGLRNDVWYDGRADIIDSTKAAITYLSYLHKHFDGNWELALASYNGGEGYVGRQLANSKKKDFWSLELRTETKNYVPKLLAVIEILKDPDRFGMPVPELKTGPQFEVVELDSQIDLIKAAELAGLTLNELAVYNPGFVRWVTPPDGPNRIIVPVRSSSIFTARLDQLPVTERISWQNYVIKSGDNLGSIAQRHGTSVEAIMSANKLSSSQIRAGNKLLIPLGDVAPIAAIGASRTYVVKAGDSLWKIAQNEGVTLNDLKAWNQLNDISALRPGQTIALSPTSSSRSSGNMAYEVRLGDSLTQIAQRFKVSLADIRKWNQIDETSVIAPGQLLRLELTP